MNINNFKNISYENIYEIHSFIQALDYNGNGWTARFNILPEETGGVSCQGLIKNKLNNLPEFVFIDSAGRILDVTLLLSDKSKVEFDEQNRLIKIENPDIKNSSSKFEYDERGNLISAEENCFYGKINLTRMQYDNQNRILIQTVNIPDYGYITTTYTYTNNDCIEERYKSDIDGNRIE